MTKKQFILSSSGLNNIFQNISHNQDDEFTFIFGKHEIKTKAFIAEFFSPYISQIHQTDPTINLIEFPIENVKASDDDWIERSVAYLEKLMKGEWIEINFSESKELLKISALLQNNDFYTFLQECFQTEIEKENEEEQIEDLFDLLSFINNNSVNFGQINTNEAIQFLSEHFYSIDENKIYDLPTEMFYLVLKNENLIVESEDSLLNIINNFFNKKKENGEEDLGKISIIDFYEEIDFEFLSDEVFKQFIDNFDINEMTKNLFSKIKKCFSIYKNTDKTENDHHRYKSNDKDTVYTYKIVVVGNSGVGKTVIANQLVNKEFLEDFKPTIGLEFQYYSVQADDENVKLQIWDTPGQERFRCITRAYFRNSLGVVLVFDLTNRQSFDDLSTWIDDLTILCPRNAYIVLIGNKKDLADDRKVSEIEAQAFAKRYNMFYIETSAKTGSNIEDTFVRLGEEIHCIKKSDITTENSIFEIL